MKIGLIGCGKWGRYILRDLLSLGCEVMVVARSPESIHRAQEFGATRIVGAIDQLSGCDGVVIATPTSTHFQVIKEALESFPDTPVFIEKPLTDKLPDLESLRPFAGRIFLMDKWRYHRGVLALAELVSNKKYGQLVGVQMKRLSWGTIHDDANAVWHLMPHDLAIAFELLGHIPQPESCRLDITKGTIRGMTAILGKQPWLQIEVSDRFERHHREIRAFFDDAVIILADAYSTHLTVLGTNEIEAGKPANPGNIAFQKNMPLYDELRAFVNYLHGGPQPKSSFDEAASIVSTISRCFEISQP